VARPDEELLSFIASSFRSVWALELILLLKSERRSWTHAELVAALRASELVVNNALDDLVAAGMVAVDSEGAAYRPANDQISESVDRVEQLYRTRPNTVRRAIIAASSSSAAAFADAFKLRKD
jgi:DNA-binding IclR family transcriptional regulator